jgi:hypothetical protein
LSYAHRPDFLALVGAAFEASSLYDEALRLLGRRGGPEPASHTKRGVSKAVRSGFCRVRQFQQVLVQTWVQAEFPPRANTSACDMRGGQRPEHRDPPCQPRHEWAAQQGQVRDWCHQDAARSGSGLRVYF